MVQRSTVLSHLLLVIFLTSCEGEILKNPNFEQKIDSSNWYCLGCTGNTVRDSYQGTTAFQSTWRYQNWNGPAQNIYLGGQVKVNGRYSFSCQAKLEGSFTKPQSLSATLKYSFTDGAADQYQGIAMRDKLTQDNKWFEIASDFQITDYRKPLKPFLVLYLSKVDPGINILLDKCTLTALDTNDWRTAARQRIEQLRKGNLKVDITSDKPLQNVVVKVTQLKHQFGFGSAVDSRFLQTNSNYKRWYLDNFEWAVLENDMKWKHTEATRGSPSWSNADKAMKILQDNGKTVRGHAIFWADTQRNPDWLQKINNKKEFYQTCMKRVTEVVSRYKGRLEHWDVNNEMTNHRFYADKYGSMSIRNDMFSKARSVDPNVALFMNDYNLVAGGYNLQDYIAQAKAFQKAKTPLDGIGVQGHFSERPNGPTLLSRLDRLAAVGLPIWVTELDYTNANNQERANGLEDALLAFFSHRSVGGVLFWGFYEGKHWKGKEAALVNGLDMKPNAAGQMWQRLFHKQWRSDNERKLGNLKAARKNSSTSRIFYGDYKISVTTNGVSIHDETFTIRKGQSQKVVTIKISQNVIG